MKIKLNNNMESLFVISYHGSSYNKLDRTLSNHNKLQKVQKRSDIKTVYLNCQDILELHKNHKYKFGGAWFYDICLENYELASLDIFKNYLFVFYLDESFSEQNSMYLNYRLRRIYEMMHHCKNFIIFFNNSNNFSKLMTTLEEKLELDTPLVEAKEYVVKVDQGFDNSDNYYFNLIKKKFADNILTD